MKRLLTMMVIAAMAGQAVAQEDHYHKSMRSDEDNARYGTFAAEPHFDGGGVYWSRVRNVDDVAIHRETPQDSIARREHFIRLCRQAYDAYEAGDAYHTVVYGDSALRKRYHTPELYFFMGVSYEKLGAYKDAEESYKKAMHAGYVPAGKAFADFKQRQQQRKAEEKQQRKAGKRKRKSDRS